MAWNEPGDPKGPGKDKDPWGGNDQGPPDLDEVVRQIQEKLRAMFGLKGGSKRPSGGSEGGSGGGHFASMGVGAIFLIALVLWGVSGFYTIDQADRGVVTRFGRYADTTQPGLHWHLPFPIEKVEVVNIEQIRNLEIGYRSGLTGQGSRSLNNEALMLTQDENIVDLKLAVQYKVKDAKDYLFNVKDPDETLQQATESAIREVVGKSKMDFVLPEGRNEIVTVAHKLTQEILDRYESGLLITSLNMQDAQPPEEVQDAFNDAVKAREDEVRFKNEAEAYSNDILPKARGAAARVLEDANAYKSQVTLHAEGDAQRFESILTAYEKAPEVTRKRLYIETVQDILSKTSKAVIDVKGGNNLVYLPLDRLMSSGGTDATPLPSGGVAGTSLPPRGQANAPKPKAQTAINDLRSRETLRTREGR
jgi:modulator of FtsH protease HflK